METPLWVSLLSPIVTLVGIVIAFLLGRVQGRAQTRYVKAAEVLIELRRIVLETKMYVVQRPEEDAEGKAILNKKIEEHEAELVRHVETHALWLPRPVRDRIVDIAREFGRAYEETETPDTQELTTTLHTLIAELTVEIERLLGTGPPWWKPWLLTRKGRLKRYTA